MNKQMYATLFIIFTAVFAPVSYVEAGAGGLEILQKQFPEITEIGVNEKRTLSLCPDNTCEIFVTDKSTTERELGDFAFLYIYFYSDYFMLSSWRSDDSTKKEVSCFLMNQNLEDCAMDLESSTAKCLLVKWEKSLEISHYFARNDEGEQHLKLRSVSGSSLIERESAAVPQSADSNWETDKGSTPRDSRNPAK